MFICVCMYVHVWVHVNEQLAGLNSCIVVFAFADRSEKERARSGRWLGKDGRREEEEVRVWRAWSATRESTNTGSHLPQEALGGNRVC